jgi:hypothetical protein
MKKRGIKGVCGQYRAKPWYNLDVWSLKGSYYLTDLPWETVQYRIQEVLVNIMKFSTPSTFEKSLQCRSSYSFESKKFPRLPKCLVSLSTI